MVGADFIFEHPCNVLNHLKSNTKPYTIFESSYIQHNLHYMLSYFQADEHVINKAFQDRNVERAAMKNKSGPVCTI